MGGRQALSVGRETRFLIVAGSGTSTRAASSHWVSIMNGQPFHYQFHPDGTYLLYSVGWNQTDDGGKIAYKKDNPKVMDYDEGDWVWPMPK